MIKHRSQSNPLPLEKLAVASGKGLIFGSSIDKGAATRRQKKHEMLLTFMANTKSVKHRPVAVKPKLISALLSFFI